MKIIYALALSLIVMNSIAGGSNYDNTISGPDANNNEIREDIDAFITIQGYSPAQRQSAQQVARALADVLRANPVNQYELKTTDLNLQKSINCAYSRFPESGAFQAHAEIEKLEKLTVNTKTRVETYVKFQIAMSGKVLASPQGDSCDSSN